MDEILSCLIEEANRFRGHSKIFGIETFKDEYLHKAELLEKAAEIVKQVEEIGRHGDLIDRDELISRCKDEKGCYYGHDCAVIGEAVESAPTVIPAKEATK